jgi:hypothetical protein
MGINVSEFVRRLGLVVQAPWAAWLITAATTAGRETNTAWLPETGASRLFSEFNLASCIQVLREAAAAITRPMGELLAIFAPAQFRAANAVTFVVNGALGGFAFVFIPALEIIAGYSPVVAGSALVPVTVVTLMLSGASGRLAQRIGPRPPLVTGCLVCAVASMVAARIGSHADYWTVVFPVALLFGLGLASLIPPLTASAMNSAPTPWPVWPPG